MAKLPPELAFAVRIALLRGHLLIGEELVKQQQWSAALPHFLHPTEEIYGDIKDRLAEYKVPPFDLSLKALADAVKAKKSADVVKAQKAVNDALALADSALKERSGDWTGFVVETAIETLKAATGEYKEAIVDGKIAKPVEYQDARGFIWQAERMIDSVAAESEKKERRCAERRTRGSCRTEEGLSGRHAAEGAGQGSLPPSSAMSRASSLPPAS